MITLIHRCKKVYFIYLTPVDVHVLLLAGFAGPQKAVTAWTVSGRTRRQDVVYRGSGGVGGQRRWPAISSLLCDLGGRVRGGRATGRPSQSRSCRVDAAAFVR